MKYLAWNVWARPGRKLWDVKKSYDLGGGGRGVIILMVWLIDRRLEVTTARFRCTCYTGVGKSCLFHTIGLEQQRDKSTLGCWAHMDMFWAWEYRVTAILQIWDTTSVATQKFQPLTAPKLIRKFNFVTHRKQMQNSRSVHVCNFHYKFTCSCNTCENIVWCRQNIDVQNQTWCYIQFYTCHLSHTELG
jgi:hypothetical protein